MYHLIYSCWGGGEVHKTSSPPPNTGGSALECGVTGMWETTNYKHLSLAGQRARYSNTGPLIYDEKMLPTRSTIHLAIVGVVDVVVTVVAAVVLVVSLGWCGWEGKIDHRY